MYANDACACVCIQSHIFIASWSIDNCLQLLLFELFVFYTAVHSRRRHTVYLLFQTIASGSNKNGKKYYLKKIVQTFIKISENSRCSVASHFIYQMVLCSRNEKCFWLSLCCIFMFSISLPFYGYNLASSLNCMHTICLGLFFFQIVFLVYFHKISKEFIIKL